MVEVSSRADLIERKIDRAKADDIVVSREAGGVDIRKLGEVMEAAKLMSLAGSMVPAFLRENVGGCFAILWKAYAWGLDPFSVASMAYEVENKRTKERIVAYMSMLVHAVVEARAPLRRLPSGDRERLRVRYEGEGDDRVCICSGVFSGEDEPREHRSPRLGDRKPKTRQSRDGDDWTPGSPLWQTKPDVQLWYDTSRDWARIYCPDVLLGIYSKEEMAEVGFLPAPAAPAPPDDGGLGARLTSSGLARAGFPAEAAVAAVDAGLAARDNGGAPQESLSVEQGGGGASTPSPSASGGPQDASDAAAAPPAPDLIQRRPRPSRARRSGRPSEGDSGRLV